jgi:hypothetical protein
MRITTLAKSILPLGAALALAACGGAEEEEEPAPAMTETPLEVDDLSGGELIGVNADAEGVDVELPETPMTNASEEEIEAAAAAEEAAE